MLADLTDELDAMLQLERKDVINIACCKDKMPKI
jgi:hypothetical protein